MSYPVFSVSSDEKAEPLGSKEKFWCTDPDNVVWLFKYNRKDAGDDWAEKISAELCELIGLPHAAYELAEFDGNPGVVSKIFVPSGWRLEHGDEVLSEHVSTYQRTQARRNPEYTLEAVFNTLERVNPNLPPEWHGVPGIRTSQDLFVGYILFDTWVSNTDRHQENWALLANPETTSCLAPTYDHGACLGTVLTDDERAKRMRTKDRGFSVEHYVTRCRSAFYTKGSRRKMLTIDALNYAKIRYPAATDVWHQRLYGISRAELVSIVNEIPVSRMSAISREFVLRMLDENRTRIVEGDT